MPLPSEQPLYVLYQKTSRAVIPKVVTLLFLSALFYVGVLLNVNQLELQPSEETTIQISALTFLLVIVIISTIVAVRKAHQPYHFYRSRIVHGKKEIAYTSIVNTEGTTDLLGKMFRTYTINLGNDFHLRHISNEIKIQDYIQQMREYAKRNSSSPSGSPQ